MRCRHHPDRVAAGIVDLAGVPVCAECARLESEYGLLVVPVPDDDEVLSAEFIDA